MSENKTTFLLADDHSLIRQGVAFLLEEIEVDCEILQVSTLSAVLETLAKHPIDIAIIDVHFPDGNSISVIPQIKKTQPDIKILIFTGIDEEAQALKFINAGADGFLSKVSEEEEIKNAILNMQKYGQYISPMTQSLLLNSLQNPKVVNPLSRLTEREMEIAQMYAKGYGNLEIANNLSVKQNTISTIKKRIFEKLNIQNIVELSDLIKSNHL